MGRLFKNGRAESMRKSYTIIVLCFVLSFLVSCSTMQYAIKRNQDLTAKQVDCFYQKNGNAFYLSSSYASFSVVWTYYEDRVEIYWLQKGKIERKQIINDNETIQYAEVSLEDIEKELYQRCAMELDGDMFGFMIEIDRKTHNADYAVDINCLKQGKYKSDFLNRITNDIKRHKMWEIEYQ